MWLNAYELLDKDTSASDKFWITRKIANQIATAYKTWKTTYKKA